MSGAAKQAKPSPAVHYRGGTRPPAAGLAPETSSLCLVLAKCRAQNRRGTRGRGFVLRPILCAMVALSTVTSVLAGALGGAAAQYYPVPAGAYPPPLVRGRFRLGSVRLDVVR